MPARRIQTLLINALGKMSTTTSLVAAAVLLCVIGVLDWLVAPGIGMSIFYLLPLAMVTYRNPRWMGLAMGLVCGVTWLGIELSTNKVYARTFVPFWNSLVRTAFFCLVSGLMTEVRERRRAEQSLRISQRLLQERAEKLTHSETALKKHTDILQSILNSMSDGVVVSDSDGRLVLINPAAKRLLRLDEKNAFAAAFDFSRNGISAKPTATGDALQRAMRGEAVDGAELWLRSEPGGSGTWVLVTGRPLLDTSGRATGGVVVLNDITTRKDIERRVVEVSDREQRRIGEDLHDGLCQQLVGIAFAARKLAGRLWDLSLKETSEAVKIAELLSESISSARDVARGLYLVHLEADGLSSALDELASEVCSRTGVTCQFIEENSGSGLNETVATSLFRIAQEAINNSLKHAQAKHITISLVAEPQQITLSVEDDGTGFSSQPENSDGMGIQIMNYRARLIEGAFHIRPRPGGGTIVSCSIRRQIEREVTYAE